jgi:replicative DNA helicase
MQIDKPWSFPLEAIQCAIGSAFLVEPDHKAVRALKRLTAEDMPRPYSDILQACKSLALAGRPCDLVSVKNWLVQAGHTEDGSDVIPTMLACAESVPTPHNGPEYCEIVERATAARRVYEGIDHASKSLQKLTSVEDVEDTRRELVESLRDARRRRVKSLVKLADFAPTDFKPNSGIPTIFPTVNKRLTGGAHGFTRGTFNVVGGLRGTSKSNFGMQQCLQSAKQGHPALFLSLEMTPHILAERLMKMLTGYDAIPTPDDLYSDERVEWDKAIDFLASLPLYTHAPEKLDPKDILDMLYDHHDLGVRMFVIDYLQILTENYPADMFKATQEVSKMFREAARSLPDSVIIGLSQLTDKGDGRFSARGGQEWENPASLCINLHFDSCKDRGQLPRYDKTNPKADKPLIMEITKNRHGPGTGVKIPIYLDTKYLHIYEETE